MENLTQDQHQKPSLQATSPIATQVFEAFIPGFGVLSNALAAYLAIDLSSVMGTALFVFSIFSAAKWLQRAFQDMLARFATSSVYIDEWDDLFDNIMDWISDNSVTRDARRLTAATRSDFPWHLQPTELPGGRNFNFKDFEARFPPIFAPAHGDHWFFHNGRLFWFERDRRSIKETSSWRSETTDREYMRISCLGWSTDPIKSLIDECRYAAAEKERASTIIRFPNPSRGNYWSRAGIRASRAVDTIYLAQEKKDSLLTDIEAFLQPAARYFYSHRGIPYRRGYLFWGEPGTGKTSMAFGIAGMYGLSLQVLSLSDPSLSDQDLQSLFASLPMSCVVLMEDIDTLLVSRKKSEEEKADQEKKEESDAAAATAAAAPAPVKKGRFNNRNPKATGVTLSGLLNALDGVASQEGRILIMTTNAPDILDPALIRPGRVDMQIYFGHLTKQCAGEMFRRMFDPSSSKTAARLQLDANPATDRKLEPCSKPGEKLATADVSNGRVAHGQGVNGHAINGHSLNEHKKNLLGTAEVSKSTPIAPDDFYALSETFAQKLPEGKLTPAEVQGFLLRQRGDPYKAIAEFDDWATETIDTKEKGENVVRENEDSQPLPQETKEVAAVNAPVDTRVQA